MELIRLSQKYRAAALAAAKHNPDGLDAATLATLMPDLLDRLDGPTTQAGLTAAPDQPRENAKIFRRAKRRGEWLDAQYARRDPAIPSDFEFSKEPAAPSCNTMKVYRRGTLTHQTRNIRQKIAKALSVEFSQVPE